MQITITPSLSQAERALTDLAKRKLPRAVLNAVNDVAFDIRAATQQEMKRVFDRPTPFALNMLEIIKARNVNQPAAIVQITGDNRKDKTFKHLYLGGVREWKRMEGAFYRRGLLPAGMIMVPARDCPKNANGDPNPGFIVQMLAYFQAFGQQGYTANMTQASKARFLKRQGKKLTSIGAGVEYFVSRGKGLYFGKKSTLPAGIYRRVRFASGSSLQAMFWFVRRGQYRRWLNLEQIARDTHGSQYEQRLANRLGRAIAGALGDAK